MRLHMAGLFLEYFLHYIYGVEDVFIPEKEQNAEPVLRLQHVGFEIERLCIVAAGIIEVPCLLLMLDRRYSEKVVAFPDILLDESVMGQQVFGFEQDFLGEMIIAALHVLSPQQAIDGLEE